MVGVRPHVDVALEAAPDDWRTAIARTLADALDDSPNAAMAAELRRVMGVIHDSAPAMGVGPEGSTVDDLAQKRAARRAKAAGSQ
jgi:hypothetical protein